MDDPISYRCSVNIKSRVILRGQDPAFPHLIDVDALHDVGGLIEILHEFFMREFLILHLSDDVAKASQHSSVIGPTAKDRDRA